MQLRDSGRFNVTSKILGDGKLMRECSRGGGGVANWEDIFGLTGMGWSCFFGSGL